MNNLILGSSNTVPGSLTIGSGGYVNPTGGWDSKGIGGLRIGYIEFINPSDYNQSAYMGFTNSCQLILTSNINYLGQNGISSTIENATNCGEIDMDGTNLGSRMLNSRRLLILGSNAISGSNSVLTFN